MLLLQPIFSFNHKLYVEQKQNVEWFLITWLSVSWWLVIIAFIYESIQFFK